MVRILIGSVRVPLDASEEEILNKAKNKMKRAGLYVPTLHFRLYKKSIDARKRNDICLVYTVLAEGKLPRNMISQQALSKADARLAEEHPLRPVYGTEPLSARPLVVGMGPAGLFTALLLARNGYAPYLIDRGASVEERVRDVTRFQKEGILDPNSNIQFGAGGAGTFSDGKLVTRIHDDRCSFVLRTLHEFGAPEDILLKAKPHIGTDRLREVVNAMLDEIERLGGSVLYHCRMEDFSECADGTITVKTSRGEFSCGAMILAIGHSARDTYLQLLEKQFAMEPKPISVGVRAEHLQKKVDEALYGTFAGHPNLGPAEYAFSDTTARGVYTFCMCPGGEVVAASSEEGGLVVNGMSCHARDGKNANAAVVVSVGRADMEPQNGSPVLGAIAFQRKIEQAAFAAGGRNYFAPIMTVGDFLNGSSGTVPTEVQPSFRNGAVRLANFETVFPPFVIDGLRRGICSFERKMKGYADPNAVLTAAETRTSAPLRILRHPETFTAIGHSRIYPCGEGAGYAGGITSAAVDGVRCAMALMERFAPLDGNI